MLEPELDAAQQGVLSVDFVDYADRHFARLLATADELPIDDLVRTAAERA